MTGERKPRLLLVITLAERGGAQSYVASLLPAVAERYDTTLAAHGHGPLSDAASAAGVEFVSAAPPAARPQSVSGRSRAGRTVGTDAPTPPGHRSREQLQGRHPRPSRGMARGCSDQSLHGPRLGICRLRRVRGSAVSAWPSVRSLPLTSATICVAEYERRVGLSPRAPAALDRTVVIPNAVQVSASDRARMQRSGVVELISVGRLRAPEGLHHAGSGARSSGARLVPSLVGRRRSGSTR